MNETGECSPPESEIQKGLLSGRCLKRIHPDTQNIQGSVEITIGNKTAGTPMSTDRQRFFHNLTAGGTFL
ncbi:hypothetical protein DENIS_2580 [Desulfonema ishimotonii]|uniref:Uncharacterized protein n=1 Tax=Desulfonema ishimotonii TaxID=45657 RepID=A0A401FXA1_9BACT|nr:hypothetical protein DENIS_2580 [Desulfonema ishimotonii]